MTFSEEVNIIHHERDRLSSSHRRVIGNASSHHQNVHKSAKHNPNHEPHQYNNGKTRDPFRRITRLLRPRRDPKTGRIENYGTILLLIGFIITLCFMVLSVLLFGIYDYNHSLRWIRRTFISTNWFPRSRNGEIPPLWDRFTDIDCTEHTKSCRITNLYFINGEFHAYVGDMTSYLDPALLNLTIYTGIGFGSPELRFQTRDHLAFPEDKEAIVVESDGNSNSDIVEKEKATTATPLKQHIPIHVHYQDPPDSEALSMSNTKLKYHTEPVAFFSVMWENLFRTMYAGVGAWLTMMEWGVGDVESARMVLIDPQRPTMFLYLLQSVTPYPITWFDDKQDEDAIFETAVIGISRELNVPEIKVETRLHEHDFLRDDAFRRFCAKVKMQILEGVHDHRHHGKNKIETIPGNVTTEILPENPISADPETDSKPLNLTLILRDGSTRKILNQEHLITTLTTSLPNVRISTYKFGGLSIREQVEIIDQSDIIIAMHGAALTHVLFSRPGTVIYELFPYMFRKTIYQNLARIMGLRYIHWQNTDLTKTVFDWQYVETHRFTERVKEDIIAKPIDWYNMDSKNYWRNQDTVVNLNEFLYTLNGSLGVVATSMSDSVPVQRVPSSRIRRSYHQPTKKQQEHTKSPTPPTKYLLIQPWGYLGEQLMNIKSACAVASHLDRTLILPFLGGNPSAPTNDDHDQPYKPGHYKWKPLEYYFHYQDLLNLPCHITLFNNFYGTNQNQSIGEIKFFSDQSITLPTIESSVKKFFQDIIEIPHEGIKHDSSAFHQLSEYSIHQRFGYDNSRVIALGPLFPFYDFTDLLSNTEKVEIGLLRQQGSTRKSRPHLPNLFVPLYTSIIRNLQFRPDIIRIAQTVFWTRLFYETRLDTIMKLESGREWDVIPYVQQRTKVIGVHVRRGKEWGEECGLIMERFDGGNGGGGGGRSVGFWEKAFGGGGNGFNSNLKMKSCFQNVDEVAAKISSVMGMMVEGMRRNKVVEKTILYIAIDGLGKNDEEREEMEELRTRVQHGIYGEMGYASGKSGQILQAFGELKVLFMSDVLDTEKEGYGIGFQKLDPVELALFEMVFCTEANIFIGNKFSSFSREVAERRFLAKKKNFFF